MDNKKESGSCGVSITLMINPKFKVGYFRSEFGISELFAVVPCSSFSFA